MTALSALLIGHIWTSFVGFLWCSVMISWEKMLLTYEMIHMPFYLRGWIHFWLLCLVADSLAGKNLDASCTTVCVSSTERQRLKLICGHITIKFLYWIQDVGLCLLHDFRSWGYLCLSTPLCSSMLTPDIKSSRNQDLCYNPDSNPTSQVKPVPKVRWLLSYDLQNISTICCSCVKYQLKQNKQNKHTERRFCEMILSFEINCRVDHRHRFHRRTL